MKDLLQRFLEDLCRRVESRLKVRSIILFGSYARGDYDYSSDIDLIIVSDDFPGRYSARLDAIMGVLKESKESPIYAELKRLGYRIAFNPVLYHPDDLKETPPLLLDVVEDGMVLRDDGLMKEKLEQVRRRLRELGSRRVWTRRGSWYWILKPDIKPGEIFEI